jgi:hypothetical protein
VHAQQSLTTAEAEFALEYLNSWFPALDMNSQIASDEVVNLQLALHDDRSSGDPWSSLGCPQKLQAFEKFGLQQLEEYYASHWSVVSSTLKDELRKVGKDARFFRPQDVSSYIEGVRLFYHQNEYLTQTFASPVFCRYVTPGTALSRVFQSIESHSENRYAADGSSWDANFPLAVASVIATFRAKHSPERFQRYYRQMYNGVTRVMGEGLRLIGQPSGHYNTSVDNCLAHMVLIAVHGYRHGLSVEQINADLLYYCCGDDIIWSTKSNIFAPANIDATYSSLGVYLEYEYLVGKSVMWLSFCGATPIKRDIRGVRYMSYYMSHPKCHASLLLHRVKSRPLDVLNKLCCIAQLYFMNEDLFNYAKTIFTTTLSNYVASNLVSFRDPNVLGCLRALNEQVLIEKYTGFETSSSPRGRFKSDAEAQRRDKSSWDAFWGDSHWS